MNEGVSTQSFAIAAIDAAYEQAYEQHWRDVFRFAAAWTNDWAAAEDLAQEAFVRLWNGRNGLDWDRPVLPWLLVTTKRLATDRFRALRRRVMGVAPAQPDEQLRARWLDVQRAMASLSRIERTAIVMTAIDGYSYDDAAAVIATSPGALRAAVSRARQKLERA